MSITIYTRALFILALGTATAFCFAADHASPAKKSSEIPVAVVPHPAPVDFEKEILPALSTSCLACHNKTKSKAGLVLETPADIRKGGDEGAVIVPGKGLESLMLKAASHAVGIDHPMPPLNNKVAAPDLTPQQLGLLQLWIDQGGTGEVKGSTGPLSWQSMPSALESIYAVAISQDGHFAACGRANRIDVYALPSGAISGSLVDPKLASAGPIAHRDMVESLAFSPDGTALASGSFREVKLWKRSTVGAKLELGAKPAACIATTVDGTLLATGGEDGIVRLWDAVAVKSVGELSGHAASPLVLLSFSPDGTKLAGGSKDKTIQIWDVKERKVFCHAEVSEEPGALCWTASGTQVAVGGPEGLIRIWKLPDAAEGEMTLGKVALKGHDGPITALAMLPNDATHLLSGGEDGTVRRWNFESGSAGKQMKHGSPVVAIAVRKDGKRFASAGRDGTAKLWNAEDVHLIADLSPGPVRTSSSLSADRALGLAKNEVAYRKNRLDISEKAAKGSSDRAQKSKDSLPAAEKSLVEARKVFDSAKAASDAAADAKDDKKAALAKDLEKARNDFKKAEIAKTATDEEIKLSTSALAESNATVAAANATLAVATDRLKNCEATKSSPKPNDTLPLKPLHAMVFSPDGSLLATGGEDGIVRTWNSENGTGSDSSPDAKAPILAVGFASGGRVVACSTLAPPGIWSAQSSWTLNRVIGNVDSSSLLADRVMSLDFSPDGTTLVTGGGVPSRSGEIHLFDPATGALKKSYDSAHSDSVLCVRFNPDGSRVASSSADRFVRVLDLSTGKVIYSLEGHSNQALGVAWSHDGHTLASAGADNVLRFWDAESGSRGKVISTFEKEATGVCYVGDVDQVVVSGGDGKVRTFRENGSDGKSFPGFSDFVYSVAASADGATIVAGGQDGTLRVWDAASGNLRGTFPSPRAK